ncbi:MAG: glycosyltransferase, partial [Candidatus Hodarchaeota archaeon]
MRVCFISFEYPPKNIGGIGTYAEHLAKGLDDMGIEVNVLTRGTRASSDPKTYRIPIKDTLYWRRFYFTKRAVSLLHSLNRRCKFDLVNLNGTYPITRRLKLPTVSTFHAAPNV